MKKLILASAITAIAAGSANAATVYEGNGLKYQVKGDFQIQLRQDIGDDQELDVEFDDLEIKNTITYDLGDDLQAFGQLDFGFKEDAEGINDGSDLEEAYVGLKYGAVSVAIGKMDFASDSFGVDRSYESAPGVAEDRFDAQGTNGDDESKADDINYWYANATYAFPAQKNVSIFAEVGDTDEDDVDVGFLSGLRIKF